jgi:hypothetical protein
MSRYDAQCSGDVICRKVQAKPGSVLFCEGRVTFGKEEQRLSLVMQSESGATLSIA